MLRPLAGVALLVLHQPHGVADRLLRAQLGLGHAGVEPRHILVVQRKVHHAAKLPHGQRVEACKQRASCMRIAIERIALHRVNARRTLVAPLAPRQHRHAVLQRHRDGQALQQPGTARGVERVNRAPHRQRLRRILRRWRLRGERIQRGLVVPHALQEGRTFGVARALGQRGGAHHVAQPRTSGSQRHLGSGCHARQVGRRTRARLRANQLGARGCGVHRPGVRRLRNHRGGHRQHRGRHHRHPSHEA